MASLFANQATKKSQQQQQGNGHVSNTGDWIPDDDGDVCNRCFKQVKAGLFTSGKHHCRRCGQMVCGLCSKKKISLARLGKGSDPVRVCDHCYSHEARRAACLAEYIPKLMQGNVFVKFPSEGTTGMGKAHRHVHRPSSHYQVKQPKAIFFVLFIAFADQCLLVFGLEILARAGRIAGPSQGADCNRHSQENGLWVFTVIQRGIARVRVCLHRRPA